MKLPWKMYTRLAVDTRADPGPATRLCPLAIVPAMMFTFWKLSLFESSATSWNGT